MTGTDFYFKRTEDTPLSVSAPPSMSLFYHHDHRYKVKSSNSDRFNRRRKLRVSSENSKAIVGHSESTHLGIEENLKLI